MQNKRVVYRSNFTIVIITSRKIHDILSHITEHNFSLAYHSAGYWHPFPIVKGEQICILVLLLPYIKGYITTRNSLTGNILNKYVSKNLWNKRLYLIQLLEFSAHPTNPVE